MECAHGARKKKKIDFGGHPNSVTLRLAGMGSRQFCRGRGRGRGREVEAEARQGSNVLNRCEARQGRGRGRELEAEARQTKLEAMPRRGRAKSMLCHFEKLISKFLVSFTMHNAHVVVTCSCFVINDIYQ